MATTTMRKTIQVVFLIATTLATIIALTSLSQTLTLTHDKNVDNSNNIVKNSNDEPHLQLPSRRVSRFLAQTDPKASGRNPNAADHCNKDNEVCNNQVLYGKNATCCNNKCIDLSEDDKNCGACKNKCMYTQHCCRGQCVNLSYDARFCGSCYNKCLSGQYCIYGLCDYA